MPRGAVVFYGKLAWGGLGLLVTGRMNPYADGGGASVAAITTPAINTQAKPNTKPNRVRIGTSGFLIRDMLSLTRVAR